MCRPWTGRTRRSAPTSVLHLIIQLQSHHDRPRPDHLPSVRDVFESFARYWGWQIGAKYGQAYLATSPLNIPDPMVLVKHVVPRP